MTITKRDLLTFSAFGVAGGMAGAITSLISEQTKGALSQIDASAAHNGWTCGPPVDMRGNLSSFLSSQGLPIAIPDDQLEFLNILQEGDCAAWRTMINSHRYGIRRVRFIEEKERILEGTFSALKAAGFSGKRVEGWVGNFLSSEIYPSMSHRAISIRMPNFTRTTSHFSLTNKVSPHRSWFNEALLSAESPVIRLLSNAAAAHPVKFSGTIFPLQKMLLASLADSWHAVPKNIDFRFDRVELI